MTMATSRTIAVELERIRLRDKAKKLRPEAVVDFAEKNPKSALGSLLPSEHDSIREFRLHWARNIIRVNVKVIPYRRQQVTVHAYISLSSDRGNGYERIEVVMEDPDKRVILLHDVLDRLETVGELHLFPELKSIAEAIADVRLRYPKSSSSLVASRQGEFDHGRRAESRRV